MQYGTWTGVWVEVMYSNPKRKQIMKPCHSDPTVGYLGRHSTKILLAWNFQGCGEIVCTWISIIALCLTFIKNYF